MSLMTMCQMSKNKSRQSEEAEDGQRLDESGHSDHAADDRETELSEGDRQYNGEQESSDWLNDEEAEDSQRQDERRQSDHADNREGDDRQSGGDESSDWDEEAEDELDNEKQSTTCLDPSWLSAPKSSVIWIVQEDDYMQQNSILDSHHGSCLNTFCISWQSLLLVLCISITLGSWKRSNMVIQF